MERKRKRLREVSSAAERVVMLAKSLGDVDAVFQSEAYKSLSQQQKLDILSYLSIAEQEEQQRDTPICACGQPIPRREGLSRAFADAVRRRLGVVTRLQR